MNSEFHYHTTYLITTRAGFPPEDARIIATANRYMRGDRGWRKGRKQPALAKHSETKFEFRYSDFVFNLYWMDEAVNENVRGLRDRSDFFVNRWDPLTDIYTWKNPDDYKTTPWYRLQEAVKQHQSDTLAILMESNLKGLELPEL